VDTPACFLVAVVVCAPVVVVAVDRHGDALPGAFVAVLRIAEGSGRTWFLAVNAVAFPARVCRAGVLVIAVFQRGLALPGEFVEVVVVTRVQLRAVRQLVLALVGGGVARVDRARVLVVALDCVIAAPSVAGIAVDVGAIDVWALDGDVLAFPVDAIVGCAPVVVVAHDRPGVALACLDVAVADEAVFRIVVALKPWVVHAFADLFVARVDGARVRVATVNQGIEAAAGVGVADVDGARVRVGAIDLAVVALAFLAPVDGAELAVRTIDVDGRTTLPGPGVAGRVLARILGRACLAIIETDAAVAVAGHTEIVARAVAHHGRVDAAAGGLIEGVDGARILVHAWSVFVAAETRVLVVTDVVGPWVVIVAVDRTHHTAAGVLFAVCDIAWVRVGALDGRMDAAGFRIAGVGRARIEVVAVARNVVALAARAVC
jgi:hypothetical protein